MGTYSAAIGVFVGALAVLALYHVAVIRPALARQHGLLETHDELIAGGSGSAAGRLGAVESAQADTGTAMRQVEQRVRELERLSQADLSHAGFVRYDAFSNSGSGLSYALALLNRQGDGVVLTSIYSREDTRTFGKPVEGFKPTVQASSEELEAIERARQTAS